MAKGTYVEWVARIGSSDGANSGESHSGPTSR